MLMRDGDFFVLFLFLSFLGKIKHCEVIVQCPIDRPLFPLLFFSIDGPDASGLGTPGLPGEESSRGSVSALKGRGAVMSEVCRYLGGAMKDGDLLALD